MCKAAAKLRANPSLKRRSNGRPSGPRGVSGYRHTARACRPTVGPRLAQTLGASKYTLHPLAHLKDSVGKNFAMSQIVGAAAYAASSAPDRSDSPLRALRSRAGKNFRSGNLRRSCFYPWQGPLRKLHICTPALARKQKSSRKTGSFASRFAVPLQKNSLQLAPPCGNPVLQKARRAVSLSRTFRKCKPRLTLRSSGGPTAGRQARAALQVIVAPRGPAVPPSAPA